METKEQYSEWMQRSKVINYNKYSHLSHGSGASGSISRITKSDQDKPLDNTSTQATSLSDVVDAHEFIENPLDIYENYTYNIEWFVVDRDADRKFQSMEAFNIGTIVSGGWPGVEDNKITIAETGVTTEFNISDLTIESVGTGNATTSKIAGTATTLMFNVTQIGATNLVDNIQNTIALCGYPTINTATFYIKISFVGFDKDGKSSQIPQTKVIPFFINQYTQLQTETDARGTTTAISGVIVPDKVVMDHKLSRTEDGFEYKVEEDLAGTLKNFIIGLNKSIADYHKTLDKNLQNSYKITVSTQFDEWVGNAHMRGGYPFNTNENMKSKGNNEAEQVGQVMPGMNIYNIIEDICINAKEIKEELNQSWAKYTKVLKITPFLVPKKNGYNPIEGTNSYEIEFFIDYEKKLIIQNMFDQWDKATKSRKLIEELFKDEHVNKIYHYLFTGKNDHILDFRITLDQELAKIYTTPSDWWAYEHFIKIDTKEGGVINKHYQDIIAKSEENHKPLLKETNRLENLMKTALEEYTAEQDSFKNQLIGLYAASRNEPEGMHNDMFKDMSLADVLKIVSNDPNVEKYDKTAKFEYMKKLAAALDKAREKYEAAKNKSTASQTVIDRQYKDFVSSEISAEFNWNPAAKAGAQAVLDSIKSENTNNMILTEELDDDTISKLSNQSYKSILKSQVNNPIVFKRLINKLSEDDGTNYTIKSTEPEQVENARAKYYESKKNNISMINATMSIRGDPYWLEGYMSPSVAKAQFGNVGTLSDKGLNAQTSINGSNGLILVSGIAAGVDLFDNVLKRNLITSLYVIKNITSSFSGGMFTQTLQMIKNCEAEFFDDVPSEISPNIESSPKEVIVPTITVEFGDPEPLVLDSSPSLGQKVADILIKIKDKLLEPFVAYSNRTLGENAEKYNTEHEEAAENYVAAVAQQTTPNLSFEANALDRQNHAAAYLNGYRFLDKMCEIQDEGDKTSCESQENARNDVLSVFVDANGDPLTVEDRGDPAAAALINQQVNDMLAANPNVTVSPYEVAAWQHAIGYELDICRPGTESCFTSANDKRWTEDHIKYKTGERTPIKIMDEQQNYEIPPVDVSGQSGALNDNRILDGSLPLNGNGADGTLINADEPHIKTMAEIDEEYEAIYEDTSETAACDAACRTKKAILLTKDVQTLAYAEYYQNKEAKKLAKNSCPAGMSSEMNIKKRRLECVPIPKDTLTDIEINDINILSEEMNGLFQNHELTSEDKNTHQVWTGEAYIALDNAFPTIDKDEKDKIQTKIAEEVGKSVMLNSLSDNDYRAIQGLETGINTVILDAQDGHRGDLTTAVNVGLNEDELAILNEQRAETKTNLSKFNWTTDGRRVFEDELDSIDVEIAKNTLSQFDEHMTAVATICSGSTCEYVPIYNPTKKDDHTTAIIKNADEQFDVVLAGVDNTYAGVTTQNNLDQLTQAKNIYYQLTSTAAGDMTTVEDDWGLEIEVKDFSNISPIIYTDANGVTQTITDPSQTFGIHTTSYSDIVPAYKQDYKLLREKVATLFPNIEVISNIDLNGIALTLSTLKDDTGMIIMQGTTFYINP